MSSAFRCYISCTAVMKFGGGNVTVHIDSDLADMLVLHTNQYGVLEFIYDSCYQPMNDVTCRIAEVGLVLDMRLCNGMGELPTIAPFLLQENNWSVT